MVVLVWFWGIELVYEVKCWLKNYCRLENGVVVDLSPRYDQLGISLGHNPA